MFTTIIVLTACQDKINNEYPLGLVVLGPFPLSEYQSLQETIWLKNPIDIHSKGILDGENVFYILEVSNNASEDTIQIASTRFLGKLDCRYQCFDYYEDKHLVPKRGRADTEDFEEWVPILPGANRRYITWFRLEECELIALSLKTKSKLFDSLNMDNPVRYFWDSCTPIELMHPVFLYQKKDGKFIPSFHIDIQGQLDKSMRKLKIEKCTSVQK